MQRIRRLARESWNALRVTWHTSSVRRIRSVFRSHCIGDCYEFKFRCALFARMARLRLLVDGLPLKRRFLVLPCMEGSHASGLFSEFSVVPDLLEHYETLPNKIAGFRADLSTGGLYHDLYHDPAFVENWWEYYFEHIAIENGSGSATNLVSPLRHDLFADEGESVSRHRAFELLDQNIHPLPRILINRPPG